MTINYALSMAGAYFCIGFGLFLMYHMITIIKPGLRRVFKPTPFGAVVGGMISGYLMIWKFLGALIAYVSIVLAWIVFDLARFFLSKRMLIEP